jgi:hypothetical protein
MTIVSWNDIRQQVLDNPEVQAEYEALEEEFKLARQIISLRKASGLIESTRIRHAHWDETTTTSTH